LRSGFLTEAARRGVPLPEAMRQSQHRSVQPAARCEFRFNPATDSDLKPAGIPI
jgi:hypothetical protein